MNGPIDLPCLAAIEGCFPAPVKFSACDVLPNHALQDLGPVRTSALTLQNHLAIFEFADKIEVAAFIVNPGLLPLAGFFVEGGNARAAQVHRISAGKIFLHHTTVEDSLDGVCTAASLPRVLSGPSEIPFAHPEIELLLLWSRTGIRLNIGLRRESGKKQLSEQQNEESLSHIRP